MSNDYIACLERPWREPKNIPVGWQRIQDAPRNGELIWLWDGMRLERLYLDGIAEGIKAAQNLPASAQTQGTEHE